MSSTPGARWTNLTRVYVGIVVARVVLYAVAYAARARLAASPALANALGVIQLLSLAAGAIVGLVWLHRAWARIPPPCRVAYDGRRIEPDEALWKFFIPFYNVYWLFLANIGLCGAVERHLERHGARSVKAPSTLALVAGLVQLVPIVNLFLSPLLWSLFMVRVDAAQAEADRRDPDARAPAPLGLAKTFALVGGALVFGWGMLFLLFIAIWQFLSPDGPGAP